MNRKHRMFIPQAFFVIPLYGSLSRLRLTRRKKVFRTLTVLHDMVKVY